MILNSLRLHPFGGVSDRKVDFGGGLNVVLGANEAGKSTLVKALRCVLFVPAGLTQVQFRNQMTPYLPLAGGDTVRVDLSFAVAGSVCRLEKSWGGTKMGRLSLAGGGEFTDAGKVAEMLKELLVLNEGTFEKVLITSQSGLAHILSDLAGKGDVLNSFSDILRKSVLDAGGVSTGRLQENVRKTEEEYYLRWNEAERGPEGGKGIGSPWIKGVGRILEAYYELERCKRDLARAGQYDLRIDEFVHQIGSLEHRVDTLQHFVKDNGPIAEDARTRAELNLKKEGFIRDIKGMKEAASGWPKDEAMVEVLNSTISSLASRLGSLQTEQEKAEQFDKQKALRQAYDRALPLHRTLKEEEQKLSAMPAIADVDLNSVREIERGIKGIEIQIQAQKLTFEMLATAPLDGELRAAVGESKPFSLDSGESLRETVAGRLVLVHKDWTLTVSAGTGEDQSLLDRREQFRTALAEVLDRNHVPSIGELESRHGAYKHQLDTVKTRRAALAAVTGGKSFDAIESEVRSLPEAGAGRSLVEIHREITQLSNEIAEHRASVKAAGTSIDRFRRQYGDQQALQDALLARLGEEKEVDRLLASLKPLPAGYDNAGKFVAEFNLRSAELDTSRNELHEIQINRKEFEKNEPETSVEDLRTLFKEKVAVFERVRREGEAYRRMRQELESILAALDTNTFVPFQTRMAATMRSLTEGRYTNLTMDKTIPQNVGGATGTLPVGLLSAGTLDVLALAVRLSMAEYYLRGSDGFLVMDDPLVNLDPARQQAAALCIKEFAKEKQVIVLTCHPSHAEILGGDCIQM